MVKFRTSNANEAFRIFCNVIGIGNEIRSTVSEDELALNNEGLLMMFCVFMWHIAKNIVSIFAEDSPMKTFDEGQGQSHPKDHKDRSIEV